MPSLQQGDKGDVVARLQALLCLAGFDAKPIDGDFGGGTAAAVRACQGAKDLPQSGIADDSVQAAVGMDKPDSTLAKARKLVNGGSHGLDHFTDAFEKGEELLAV